MIGAAMQTLLDRARGPVGPNVDVDFGVAGGPFAELAEVLARVNGFFAFNAGLQVFHAGAAGPAPELLAWNDRPTWKYTYEGLADNLFCFGQDVLGTQFAIQAERNVVTFEPETGEVMRIGESLEAWAGWLLEDPPVRATADLALAWQDANGPLGLDQRLVPVRPLVAGGQISMDNLVARDAVTAMRIRGPVATQLVALPDGATIQLAVE